MKIDHFDHFNGTSVNGPTENYRIASICIVMWPGSRYWQLF